MRIIRAGLQTSVQDLGRSGSMRYGVPRGGAADPVAMQLANLLLGNPPGNPVLEVTLDGPSIEFQCDISIAIVGAQFDLALNGEPVECDRVLQIESGDRLTFGRLLSGARAYIALAGQMKLPAIFGSHSTSIIAGFGGLCGRAIEKGDAIEILEARTVDHRRLEGEYRLRYTRHPQLRVVTGAEENHFGREAIDHFYSQTYQVTAQSNRMGIRLAGDALRRGNQSQVVSSGLCPGTVQIPPDGRPIISFIEGQTIGGYPRIAHVISADLHLLGQLQANDRLDFTPVSVAQAHKILEVKSGLLERLMAEFPGNDN
ncbi:biotin-dependent carboxyltransferase family protein [Microbulbifer taiwanensis]|uniref:Biotin-dependent carboxyltransferase family protein n=1 Tax=Microbulbifer taiwanensis TaxID=986746 RepID=A0ABW1YP29_9GAMM|nr:biotin-dependent carboxyltransferase family protein [Microbulbifer taiwanensis]